MRTLVASARVARLATVSPDGRPHLVPICFVLLGDTVYTAVDHKPKRSRRLRRITNLQATGHASILIDEYAEDWSRLWWIRLDGPGRLAINKEEAARALTALGSKYPQYAVRPPEGLALAIDVHHWSCWSAT
ncbi:MAG: TIGR03668 family PPOX class F420-dependent oxidoreductase [Micromonosporaceae bacterium]